MEIYRDFKELLESFNEQKVEYVVVGGYALAHHGAPRYTRDIDLYVNPTKDNAQRVLAALHAFGFNPSELGAADFEKPDLVIELGRPPDRAFLFTSIAGVSWEQAAAGSSLGDYGGTPVPFLGRAELIASKKAAGRLQDLADAERLEGPPEQT
jgi:hypothetical protein